MIKVCALNDLYSTRIFATLALAKHICSLKIDAQLEVADPEVVDRIAFVKIGDRPKKFFSFASKYCSWHDQEHYPIYDRFVHGLLVAYKQHYEFMRFSDDQLHTYRYFKEVVESFRSYFGLEDCSLKQLDKFLWLYGKELKVA